MKRMLFSWQIAVGTHRLIGVGVISGRSDDAEGARGVGSSSIGSLLVFDGFGVSLESDFLTLPPGGVNISGGVSDEPVISEAAGTSSATVGGGSMVSALGISDTDTTLPRLLVRIISIPSLELR